jgi:uncharacterized protein YjbI with pentapeptide repeats
METKRIGNKIAEARKKLAISQAQLAENLFISSQAVGKWERGESMPDITTFNRLALILGVDLNYFSESFPSAQTEKASETAELPFQERKNKRSWDMSRGSWVGADFSGLKNLNEKFSAANMQKCKFVSSDLSGLILKSNHVDGCDFTNSDISKSNIRASHLVNNLHKDCLLKETKFEASHISACDFSGADFTHATVRSCDFSKNIIENTVWNHSSFVDTHFADIVFNGTLEDCYFENCSFARVLFRNASLTNNFFRCKSLKRLKFIECSADRMTFAFLKNGKADLTGIALLTSENTK